MHLALRNVARFNHVELGGCVGGARWRLYASILDLFNNADWLLLFFVTVKDEVGGGGCRRAECHKLRLLG